MKMKTLATALTLSVPLVFGGAYAQTTTSAESGNNRSADGGAMTTNPTPEPGTGVGPDGSASAGSNSGAAATGATGAETASDAAGTRNSAGTTGNTAGTAGQATGTSGATGAASGMANTPTAPGMETQPGAAATTEAITGWSAKDDIMGKSVFNENDEKIGDVDDVVISSDGRTLYLLVGAGGFLGMGSKNVAVPFDRFERRDDRIMLSGYTKEQLKALPEVRTER